MWLRLLLSVPPQAAFLIALGWNLLESFGWVPQESEVLWRLLIVEVVTRIRRKSDNFRPAATTTLRDTASVRTSSNGHHADELLPPPVDAGDGRRNAGRAVRPAAGRTPADRPG